MFKTRNLYSSLKKYKECGKSLRGQIQIQGKKFKDQKNFKKVLDNYKTSYDNLIQKTKYFKKYENPFTSANVSKFLNNNNAEPLRNVYDNYKANYSNLIKKAKCIQKYEKTFSAAAYNKFCNNKNEVPQSETSDKEQNTANITKFLGLNSIFASAVVADVGSKTATLDPLPDIPPVPEPPPSISDTTVEAVDQLNALGEPTFASLGLGGWTPVGIVQNCFEYLHVTLGIPWWEAIVIGTVLIRTLLLPLVIIAQRNAARMNNYLPQMQAIQLKLTEARQCGNELDAARYSQELMIFMKEKSVNPLKNMIVPLAQMPVFISFFMGLREMATTPVESLKTGGLFWFTDLTLPDQYFAMPIITSLTLWATIELGTDSAKLSAQNMQIMAYVLRALPIVILPFTVNFPGAILCYWVSSNFISLLQVGILRLPGVREFFKIEPLIKHNPENLPIKKKGFKEGVKDTWTNIKISKELEERKRLDEIQFQRAGKGPVVKTYKYDPTKQTAANAVSAKQR